VNSTAGDPVQSAGTVQTVLVRNVMPEANSFWVLYGQHTKPTYLEDAGNGQQAQRDAALQYIKQWRVCLDIGSNIGQWTRPLSKKFESVVCFEPNPNFRECFEKNIQEKNVLLWPYGLSDKEHKAKQDFNSTVLQQEDGDIDCRTLDSFGLTNVDFVKIDVDGFEIPLLNGARQTLSKNDPVINIEMKRDKRTDIVVKCESILKDLGYKFQKRTKSDEVWLKS
jgi:FkbM family methyltransferase|tara:strand:- start:50 stop:718 length:669 start_codon:yes stop_codon:yes gene_type:complete